MPTFCQNCNNVINEDLEVTGQRQPCPYCGTTKRRHDEEITENLAAGAIMHTKGYAGGLSRKKGLRFESKDGDSFSFDLGRFVHFNQLVDHDADRFVKIIVDPVTGDVLREVDEPLPDHENRGSAKPRGPKKTGK